VFAVREFRALWFSEILSVAGDRLALVALTAEVALTWLEGRLIKWRPNTLEVPRI